MWMCRETWDVRICAAGTRMHACSLLPAHAAHSSMSKSWGIWVLRRDEHLVPPDALGFRTHWVRCDESRSIKENEMPVWERQQVLHTSSCSPFCLLHTFTYQNAAGMPFPVTPPAAFSSAASFCSRWNSQWVVVKLSKTTRASSFLFWQTDTSTRTRFPQTLVQETHQTKRQMSRRFLPQQRVQPAVCRCGGVSSQREKNAKNNKALGFNDNCCVHGCNTSCWGE